MEKVITMIKVTMRMSKFKKLISSRDKESMMKMTMEMKMILQWLLLTILLAQKMKRFNRRRARKIKNLNPRKTKSRRKKNQRIMLTSLTITPLKMKMRPKCVRD